MNGRRRIKQRISTKRQHLDLQLEALRLAGVAEDQIYTDTMSGSKNAGPELERCLRDLEPGDTLVIWRLDRLGRSLPHLLQTVEDLSVRGVGFESVHDHVDTTSATGRLVLHVLAALSQFERELTLERIEAGLESARRRGSKLGRPRALDAERADEARRMLAEGQSVARVARLLGVSRATLHRQLARREEPK